MESEYFDNYLEAYYVIVAAIEQMLVDMGANNYATHMYDQGGIGEMFTLARTLTDGFMTEHANTDWNKNEWFDTMENYIHQNLYTKQYKH